MIARATHQERGDIVRAQLDGGSAVLILAVRVALVHETGSSRLGPSSDVALESPDYLPSIHSGSRVREMRDGKGIRPDLLVRAGGGEEAKAAKRGAV